MAITIRDIAKKAGVSIATVSRTLNRETEHLVQAETREKVLRVVAEHNYVPNLSAVSLSKREYRMLEIILPFSPSVFGSDYFNGILAGAVEASQYRGYGLKVSMRLQSNGGFNHNGPLLLPQVDGIIVTGSFMESDFIKLCREKSFRMVLVSNSMGDEKSNFVDCDNLDGAYRLTLYLLNQGYQPLAMIKGSPDSFNARDRYNGFIQAIRKHGLTPDQKYIKTGYFTEESGYQAMKELIREEPLPRAVFCASDDMALGALRALKEKDIDCPGEVALAGCDDIRLAAYLHPSLTTVRQPVQDLGKAAVEMLVDLIQGKSHTPRKKIFPVELIIRESA